MNAVVAQAAPPEPSDQAERPAASTLWIPELDGLRAIAATSVLVHHGAAGLFAGFALANTAVSLFFVLSGFLIYTISAQEHARTGRLAVGNFFLRRIFRIWPLYFVCVAGALLIFGNPPMVRHPTMQALPMRTMRFVRDYGWAFPTFLVNWAMAFTYLGPFFWWAPDILSITWSISVEEQFYVLFPLFFILVAKGRLPGHWVVAGAFVIGLALRYVQVFWPLSHADPSSIGSSAGVYYASYSYLEMFVIGAAIGWLALRRRRCESARSMLALFGVSLVATCLLAMLWPAALWAPYVWYTPLIYTGLALSLAGLMYSVVGCPTLLPAVVLRWHPLRIVGLLSYAIYLIHLEAIRTTLWWHENVTRTTQGLVEYTEIMMMLDEMIYALILAVAVAAILHGLVERPFLLLRHRHRPKGLSTLSVPWKTTFAVAFGLLLILDTVYWPMWQYVRR